MNTISETTPENIDATDSMILVDQWIGLKLWYVLQTTLFESTYLIFKYSSLDKPVCVAPLQ